MGTDLAVNWQLRFCIQRSLFLLWVESHIGPVLGIPVFYSWGSYSEVLILSPAASKRFSANWRSPPHDTYRSTLSTKSRDEILRTPESVTKSTVSSTVTTCTKNEYNLLAAMQTKLSQQLCRLIAMGQIPHTLETPPNDTLRDTLKSFFQVLKIYVVWMVKLPCTLTYP